MSFLRNKNTHARFIFFFYWKEILLYCKFRRVTLEIYVLVCFIYDNGKFSRFFCNKNLVSQNWGFFTLFFGITELFCNLLRLQVLLVIVRRDLGTVLRSGVLTKEISGVPERKLDLCLTASYDSELLCYMDRILCDDDTKDPELTLSCFYRAVSWKP